MSEGVKHTVRWNQDGRGGGLYPAMDWQRGIRVTAISFGGSDSAYGSISVMSGKIFHLIRVEFLDDIADHSFNKILFVDSQVGSLPIRYYAHPRTFSIGLSHHMPPDRGGVYDFFPYGIPFSVMINFIAHFGTIGFVANIFWIERDKTDVELG